MPKCQIANYKLSILSNVSTDVETYQSAEQLLCTDPLVVYNNQTEYTLITGVATVQTSKPVQWTLPTAMRLAVDDRQWFTELIKVSDTYGGRVVNIRDATGAVVFTMSVTVHDNMVTVHTDVTVHGGNNVVVQAEIPSIREFTDAVAMLCGDVKSTLDEIDQMITTLVNGRHWPKFDEVTAVLGKSPCMALATVDGLTAYHKVRFNSGAADNVNRFTVEQFLDNYVVMDADNNAVDLTQDEHGWLTLHRLRGARVEVDNERINDSGTVYRAAYVGVDRALGFCDDGHRLVLVNVDNEWVVVPKRAKQYDSMLADLQRYVGAVCALTGNQVLEQFMSAEVSPIARAGISSGWAKLSTRNNIVLNNVVQTQVCPHCGQRLWD